MTKFNTLEIISVMSTLIQSHDELIDALGGTKAVAEWADVNASAISYWRTAGIPMGWHLRLAIEAKRRGLTVDYEKVFGIDPETLKGVGPDPLAFRAA